MNELAAGRVIGDGRFRLERQLGEGGMGIVWLATNLETNVEVALKFLTAGAAVRRELRERLRREARATAAVKHPNVVQILEVIEDQSIPVIVMEYLVGETLADRLDKEKPLSLETTATILLPVVSALGTAHAAGIVHRDLKPENIFLVRAADGTLEPHVLDFGLAKILRQDIDLSKSSGGHTQTGAILGTPFYMSPEQASGERGIDERADVWSLGVILYECLSGRLPYTGENFGQFFKNLMSGKAEPLSSFCPNLPRDVATAVGRALKVDRDARLGDLHELAEALRPHTSVESMPFSTPRSRREMWSEPELPVVFNTIVDEVGWEPTEPARAAAASPLARSSAVVPNEDTLQTKIPATDSSSKDVVPARVQSIASTPSPAPRPRTYLYAAGVALALLGAALVGAAHPWQTTSATGSVPEPPPPPTTASVAPPPPLASSPPSATASATAAPEASASASANVAVAPSARSPGPAKHVATAAPSASAAPAASGAKLQGGVAGEVPF